MVNGGADIRRVFISSGIMERGNFSAAAGFGAFKADRYGVFS